MVKGKQIVPKTPTYLLFLIGRPFFLILLTVSSLAGPVYLGAQKISFDFFWLPFRFLGQQIIKVVSLLIKIISLLVLFFRKSFIFSKKRVVLVYPQRRLRFSFLFKPFCVFKKVPVYLWLVFFCLISLGGFSYWIVYDLPDPSQLIERRQILSTKIYDRNNQLLYKIYRQQNRTLVDLDEIPLSLIQATVAIEDAEFYQHHGFSLKGISRAALANLKEGKSEGGSTITQQLVKNTLLSPEKTLRRKVKEIILAVLVERLFTKDEILQMYFNEVPYGGTAYGAEEAAQKYFGKSVQDLDLAQSALLAGLPASPTRYSPFGAHPELAKERQALVLRRMYQESFIGKSEEEKALNQEMVFAPNKNIIKAPHFVLWVKELLVEEFGQRMVEEGGLEVLTSLDLPLQEEAEEVVSREVEKIGRLNVSNGSALITNPQTGEVFAMVGSKNYFDTNIDGNVNITLRERQPGSTIKIINYAVALSNGFSPATIISDTPITYQLPYSESYSPRNYDDRFHGSIPLRVALASSYNVPAVKVLAAFGVERMVEMGQKMGISNWDDPSRFGLSLTLGGGEIKMVDLAVAYGTLANQGVKTELDPLLLVKNANGKILHHTQKTLVERQEKVLDEKIAFMLTDILKDNWARTPAFGPNSLLNIDGHPNVAVKTGTTQNLRDNWTIGYTTDFLVAAWVGNNDNAPMSRVASGVTGASPIWNQITRLTLEKIPDQPFPIPEGIKKVAICAQNGTLPCSNCLTKEEWFFQETQIPPCAQAQIPSSQEDKKDL